MISWRHLSNYHTLCDLAGLPIECKSVGMSSAVAAPRPIERPIQKIDKSNIHIARGWSRDS